MSDDLIKGTKMKEQWNELKETIIELRDNNGTGTQREVCQFLANLMDVLKSQMEPERKKGKWIDPAAVNVYRCSVCEEYTTLEVPGLFYHYCPNCGAEMEAYDGRFDDIPKYC